MPKSLIIVESPAKSRTLQRYLGKGYDVKASVGHVRDLPDRELGVDLENDFAPQYVTIQGKGKILAELRNAAKSADQILLAPDPDREGEAIAFHIAESLGSIQKPIRRVLFHELTKNAILAAVANATELNQRLFEAQQARRILDRLVGYKISPLLWKKVRRGLSAGRVQSVAVRMISDREKEILAFKPEEYWSVAVELEGANPPVFVAMLDKSDGKKAKIADAGTASTVKNDLQAADYAVAGIEKKQKNRHAAPPFITSSLQIEANRKLRFSAKKTMTLAQRLYEGIDIGADGPTGLITYMRTDSTRINDEAMQGVRNWIGTTYGQEFLPAKPNVYRTKKSAQDAHEAIRPTDVTNTPEKMAAFLDKDMLNLYTLIWKRFVASQMAPAILDQTTVIIQAGRHELKAVGSVVRFLGFMSLYVEGVDESSQADAKDAGTSGGDEGRVLPTLEKGERLVLRAIAPKQHFTQPPPRYTEATLVKALEENGVGRPSTYASILSTIQDKEYVRLESRKFHPTELGDLITELLLRHFPDIMDIKFTAEMEQKLDQIEEGKTNGKAERVHLLRGFYGPFADALDRAEQEMESVKRKMIPTDIACGACGGHMVIRWGRNGEFLACEKFPKCKFTQNFTRQEDGTILPASQEPTEATGEVCEKCGQPMVVRQGKYGRFLACSGYPACRHIKSERAGVVCPLEGCCGDIVKKLSKKGKQFFSCNRYPACTFASWDKPVKERCPQCDAPFLVEKESKKGGVRICCADRKCRYSRAVDPEQQGS